MIGSEKFSKNPVEIKIEKEDLDPLTIIDLPGIIFFESSVTEEDTASKILDINETYLQDKDAFIVCVVAATLDLTNSKAFTVVKKHDFTGERTILCITKIDLRNDIGFD